MLYGPVDAAGLVEQLFGPLDCGSCSTTSELQVETSEISMVIYNALVFLFLI